MTRMTNAAAFLRLGALLEEVAPDVGDRIPAERHLAIRLGCSRATLRECLRRLELEGEIWRHVGQGTFRGPRPRHLPIRETLLVDGASPADLLDARLLIEPQVAAAAARCATSADVAHLRRLVRDGMRARDRPGCEQADDAFHRAIASVAANPVLVGFLGFLSGARRRAAWQRQWDRTYRRLRVDEFQTDHSAQHRQIVDAIATQDAIAAESAMRAHLETIRGLMTCEPAKTPKPGA